MGDHKTLHFLEKKEESLKIIIIYGNDTLIYYNKVEFRIQTCEFLNIGIVGVENHT